MDKVFLTALETDPVIGIYDWERKITQRVLIDLEMATDIRRAAETDDIKYTLDYEAISNRVIAYTNDSEFGLIESLAEKISEIVMQEYSVSWVRVTVHKPGAIEAAADTGISIERGQWHEHQNGMT